MITARRLLERISRNRTFKRLLPPDFGRAALYVSPDSQLKYLKPGIAGFDASLLENVKRLVRPGMNVWDIGANVGVFAFGSAGRGAKVLAVEADPWLAQLLRSSVSLPENAKSSVKVVCAAAADKCGIADLLIAARGRASNALSSAGGNENMGGVREAISVPTLTLDVLLQDSNTPELIKVDVEGAESMVLVGAEEILSNIRPTWLIEVNKQNVEYVTDVFHFHKYQLFDADVSPGNVLKKAAFNTLAIPN